MLPVTRQPIIHRVMVRLNGMLELSGKQFNCLLRYTNYQINIGSRSYHRFFILYGPCYVLQQIVHHMNVFFKFQRYTTHGNSLPSWLMNPGQCCWDNPFILARVILWWIKLTWLTAINYLLACVTANWLKIPKRDFYFRACEDGAGWHLIPYLISPRSEFFSQAYKNWHIMWGTNLGPDWPPLARGSKFHTITHPPGR